MCRSEMQNQMHVFLGFSRCYFCLTLSIALAGQSACSHMFRFFVLLKKMVNLTQKLWIQAEKITIKQLLSWEGFPGQIQYVDGYFCPPESDSPLLNTTPATVPGYFPFLLLLPATWTLGHELFFQNVHSKTNDAFWLYTQINCFTLGEGLTYAISVCSQSLKFYLFSSEDWQLYAFSDRASRRF